MGSMSTKSPAPRRRALPDLQTAYRQTDEKHPKALLALAALDVVGQGGKITSASVLAVLSEGGRRNVRSARAAAPTGETSGELSAAKTPLSFARMARRSLGLSTTVG